MAELVDISGLKRCIGAGYIIQLLRSRSLMPRQKTMSS